ncbi:hypothetical protein ABZP36_027354 [Zizania latifolia]
MANEFGDSPVATPTGFLPNRWLLAAPIALLQLHCATLLRFAETRLGLDEKTSGPTPSHKEVGNQCREIRRRHGSPPCSAAAVVLH